MAHSARVLSTASHRLLSLSFLALAAPVLCQGLSSHRLQSSLCKALLGPDPRCLMQVHSFECQLPAPPCFQDAGLDTEDFRALFIRAPAVMSSAPDVEVLGEYTLTDDERAAQV